MKFSLHTFDEPLIFHLVKFAPIRIIGSNFSHLPNVKLTYSQFQYFFGSKICALISHFDNFRHVKN